MMTTICFDKKRGCISVELTYNNGKDLYLVDVKPDVESNKFDAGNVRRLDGKKVPADEKIVLEMRAVKEMMEYFASRLKPPVTHHTVDLSMRITISFVITILRYDTQEMQKVTPLGNDDLILLQRTGRSLSESIKKAQIDKVKTGHKLPPLYLQSLKREALHVLMVDQYKREFYSSVLTRAFAWKGGRIPAEEYAEAHKYLPGIKLAFDIE